ncbi:MAG: hypothetical protein QM844_05355, partial [Planctomycetota bacterium]|nr:hypothetical protein [Planctomycetota bacterium]
MNRDEGRISRELEDLAAAACDGELTDRETARLETLLAESPAARRYYLFYLHLHGELHWQQAVAAERPGPAVQTSRATGLKPPVPVLARAARREARTARLRWAGFFFSSALALGLLVLAWRAVPRRPAKPPQAIATQSQARFAGGVHARWGPGASAAPGERLPAQRTLQLSHGIVEAGYPGGAQLLIRAPALFSFEQEPILRLQRGEMMVRGSAADRLVLALPGGEIRLGAASLGVTVRDNLSEVHVIEGEVTLQRGPDAAAEAVKAGEARAWTRGARQAWTAVAFEPDRFPRRLPERAPTHSVAKLRSLAAAHPRLIHQYTFEGTSRLEKCRDKRGSLHLTESVMADGRGRGTLDYTAPGLDLTTEAVRPFRADRGGSSIGAGLQTETAFYPPREMTVELLLQYSPPGDEDDRSVGLAVATRNGETACGFFVAVVGRGYLSLLLDAAAEWPESGL